MRDFTLNNPGEVERRRKIAASKIMHGHSLAPHGSPECKTYATWTSMWQRCIDPNCKSFPRYGGRGIAVCPEWGTYIQFLVDMGLVPTGHTIDRIDNSLGYSKENCRWATKQEQARNRRTNRVLTINGETKTLAEWAESSGLPSSTIRMRINYNDGVVDESILRPVTSVKQRPFAAEIRQSALCREEG